MGSMCFIIILGGEAPRGVRVEKVVLVDPVSPYGFGGTKDEFGTPCYSDHAGVDHPIGTG